MGMNTDAMEVNTGPMEMNYVETPVQTRFSDFGADGLLHFSKCLMFFERARFAIAKDSGLRQVIYETYRGDQVMFVVVKVDVRYLNTPDVSYDRAGSLTVRSYLLPPFISKISFRQELVDGESGEILISAVIDNALVVEGKGLVMQLPEPCKDCLWNYYKRIEDGSFILQEDGLGDMQMWG